MWEGKRIGVLLLMGGTGKRFSSDMPKQFHRLAGKAIYLHTLQALQSARCFDEIVLSCHVDWMAQVRDEAPQCTIVAGGATRQESSLRGLLGFSMKPDVVVIHDAVRPFVTRDILCENIRLALEHGAVDTCIPSADTLVHSPDNKTIREIPKRSEFLRGQTPQSFSYPLILEAHRRTERTDATDDCQLVRDLVKPVYIASGDEHNIKITSELDLFLAEQIIRMRLVKLARHVTRSLAGKRFALVGGTGGIGQAIHRKLVENEATVVSLSRTTSPVSLDLRSPASIESAFASIGPLDGLINCAGLLLVRPLCQLSLEEIEQMIDVNWKGLILCCQKASLKRGGHLINIASSSFSRGRKEIGIYSSTKAAIVNFTQSLAEERPDLHVHAVIPQRTNTPMRLSQFPLEDPASLLHPEQVANTVVDLLMDEESTGLLAEVRKSNET